jgi:Arc/MetJ-type ribon-helix-helix transcriptional regulator
MFGEETQLIHLRFPKSMVEDMDAARHALEKPSVAELIRAAVQAYLDANAPVIKAFRRVREKHGEKG